MSGKRNDWLHPAGIRSSTQSELLHLMTACLREKTGRTDSGRVEAMLEQVAVSDVEVKSQEAVAAWPDQVSAQGLTAGSHLRLTNDLCSLRWAPTTIRESSQSLPRKT